MWNSRICTLLMPVSDYSLMLGTLPRNEQASETHSPEDESKYSLLVSKAAKCLFRYLKEMGLELEID